MSRRFRGRTGELRRRVHRLLPARFPAGIPAGIPTGIPAGIVVAFALAAGCAETPAPVPAAPPVIAASVTPPVAGQPSADETAAQTSCRGLTVVSTHRGIVDADTGMARSRLRVSHAEPGAQITLLGPYYGGLHDDVPTNIVAVPTTPRPLAFVSDLSYRRVEGVFEEEGFEQELTVSYLGPLELEVTAPECLPVRVTCDMRVCLTE